MYSYGRKDYELEKNFIEYKNKILESSKNNPKILKIINHPCFESCIKTHGVFITGTKFNVTVCDNIIIFKRKNVSSHAEGNSIDDQDKDSIVFKLDKSKGKENLVIIGNHNSIRNAAPNEYDVNRVLDFRVCDETRECQKFKLYTSDTVHENAAKEMLTPLLVNITDVSSFMEHPINSQFVKKSFMKRIGNIVAVLISSTERNGDKDFLPYDAIEFLTLDPSNPGVLDWSPESRILEYMIPGIHDYEREKKADDLRKAIMAAETTYKLRKHGKQEQAERE